MNDLEYPVDSNHALPPTAFAPLHDRIRRLAVGILLAVLGLLMLSGVPVFGAPQDAVVKIKHNGMCSGVSCGGGVCLTCWHCNLPNEIKCEFPSGRVVEAKRAYEPTERDGAVAYVFEELDVPFALVSKQCPKVGDGVYSYGFPAKDKGHVAYDTGNITGFSKLSMWQFDPVTGEPTEKLGDFRSTQTSITKPSPGWSGGPLFDSRGFVIGLCVSGAENGTTWLSWHSVKEAYQAAAVVKPHLRVWVMNNCAPCEHFKRDLAAGKFKRYTVEVLPIENEKNLKLYWDTIDAVRKAGGKAPEGIPAFHLAGKSEVIAGYGEGSGGSVLINWTLSTIRLVPDLLESIFDRSPGVASLPDQYQRDRVSPRGGAPGPAESVSPPGRAQPPKTIGPAPPAEDEDEPLLPWTIPAIVMAGARILIERRLAA